MKKCNLFYLSGLLFFLAAALNFFTGENHSTAVVWLCLGSAFLCLGYSQQKKIKQKASPGGEKSAGAAIFCGGRSYSRQNNEISTKDEVCVCQPNRSIPLLRPALT